MLPGEWVNEFSAWVPGLNVAMVVWSRVAVAVTHRVTTRSRSLDPAHSIPPTRSRSLDPAHSIPLCRIDHMAEVEQVVGQRVQQRDAAHFAEASHNKLVHGSVGLEIRVDGLHRRAAQRLKLLRFSR